MYRLETSISYKRDFSPTIGNRILHSKTLTTFASLRTTMAVERLHYVAAASENRSFSNTIVALTIQTSYLFMFLSSAIFCSINVELDGLEAITP